MAEDNDKYVGKGAYISGGTYRPLPEEPIPERGGLGYLRDKALGMVAGAIDIAASPASVVRDTSSYQGDQEASQAIQEGAANAKRQLEHWKTPYGRAQGEGKVPADTSVIGTVLDAAPVAAAIYASGPLAPVTGGVVAHGIQRTELWDNLRRLPEEELNKNPKYTEYREQGMGDLEARRQLYKDGLTFEAVAPNVGANMLMAGVGQRLMTGAIGNVLKTDAGNMAMRIIKNATMGSVEGAAAGYALGTGTEWGRQGAEIGAGLRQERDWGRINEAGVPIAENLAILGGITGGVRGFRHPEAPAAERGIKKIVGKTGEVLDDTGYTPSADEIGTDLAIVTGAELAGSRPPVPAARLPGVRTPGDARAQDVTRPGNLPGEVTSPPVSEAPKPTAAGEPPLAPAPSSRGAGAEAAPHIAPRPVEVPPVAPVVTPETVAPRVVPAGIGTETVRDLPGGGRTSSGEGPARAPAAPAAEPARAPMTVEDLRARANDISQSPTAGDVVKHIADWQEENPGVKLGTVRNEILKENRVLRETEAKRVKAETIAAKAAERVETARVAAEAKAVAEVKPETKAPTIAESIKERVATAKAAREAEATARVEAEPTVGEKIKTEVEAPKPVEEVTPPAEVTPPGKPVPLTGEAAREAIAKAAQKKQVRADAEAAAATEKADLAALRREKETDQRGERREVEKTKREQLARQTIESKTEAMDQVAALHEKVSKGRPSQIKPDIETIGRHIQGIVDSYRNAQREAGQPVLGKFASVKTRMGHGDYRNVMSDLNNIAHDIAKYLEKDGIKARDAAVEGLELIKKVREGKVGEHIAEKVAHNEKVATAFKTKTVGEKIESVRDKAEEARAEEGEKEVHDIIDDDVGKGTVEDFMYPSKTIGDEHIYVRGKPDPRDADKVDGLSYRLGEASRDYGEHKLNDREASQIFRENGETIKRGKVGDVLARMRPSEKQPELRAIFDAVYDVTKNIPVEVWSRDMMEAYTSHKYPDQGKSGLAFYGPDTGNMVLRSDTMTPMVVFHEALHAATSRALLGSERLNALVNKLQDLVEERYKGDIDVTSEIPFQRAIRMENGERVNAREFVAELFSRPEVAALLKDMKLRPKEVAELKAMGYRADIGKSILKSLWDGFLKAIGFKVASPNAFKVSVDMLQDMFEREMKIREGDAAIGRPIGSFFDEADKLNLAAQDPVGGPAIVKAFEAGDFPAVTEGLMNSAHLFSEGTLDKSIGFLKKYNEDLYGHEDFMVDPNHVTPMSNTAQVKGGIEKFLGDRFGAASKMADYGYQADKLFATPLRHMVQGMRYTQDLGNNLEKGFRDALQPMKDAMSRREHFAQEYMDKSGANKLIDDVATLKNAIKDRGLWADWQNLLIRESYTRMFADEEASVGRNSHINAGNLRDYQSTIDHKANQAALEAIRARDPGGRLLALRNRIHEFEARDLEARKRAQATDMLTRMKIVDPTADRVGLTAMIKDVRDQNSTMTTAERAAFDRIAGADHKSKQFQEWVENRKAIRALLDQTDKNGPHVPFMRHGDHVVTANYHVTPDAGVKYHQIDPDPASGMHRGYDFENLADAQGFIKNVLSREDVQITQTGGREVVYDTSTGEQARIYTVEKKDGTAKTFEALHEAEAAMEKGDEMKVREITPDDIKRRTEDNQPTGHFKIYNRVEFNPKEYVRFESEREANEYRNRINLDTHDPNFSIDVSNVESIRDIAARGVAAHASSEMTQWANRIEASPAYQKMSKESQAEWKRELQMEAARVTMMTGRRSINMPREYVKGASTDILKGLIDSTGQSARAISGNIYNPRIQLAREAAQKYTDQYQFQTGGEGRNHRARQDVLDEFDRRLHAPVRVDGSWAQGIKRALQVSMISHLADASFMVINAMEPWIFGSAITAARHGWYGAYSELAKANALVNPLKMAAEAGKEIGHALRGEYRPANYEQHLLDAVRGEKDGAFLARLLHHMFDRGLTARDTGMEVGRVHDPSANVVGRFVDRVDDVFRGGNTGIETLNRSTMGIANFRLEFRRAIKEGKSEAQAEAQAIRYAEDQVFKAAGDYGSWNNPRYFNNPFLKLATQFKKYPLRIASVYADAIIQATRGDKQAMKQVAYMLATQGMAAGALGLPIGAFAGTVNAAYILGLSDDKWADKEFAIRKWMVDHGVSPELTDLALRGALRFTGADFHPRLTQNSMVFFGDPDSRDPIKLAGVLGKTLLGSPGGWGANGLKGIQQLIEAGQDYHAGAHDQAYQKGMAGADNIIQIKALHNLVKAFQLGNQGPAGMPKGNEATTGQAIMQGIGFGPVQIARKQEEKRTIQAAKKEESQNRNVWVNRWVGATSTGNQASIWANIQRDYNPTVPPEQRIKYGDLVKAQARKARTERRDDTKLGVALSGRQKGFADIGKYFATQ